MTRIEQLKQFITEDPNDPFLRYGLALEYLHDQPGLASEVFEQLMAVFPEYLPTYYPAANLFLERGGKTRADETFRKGIELAKRQGDRKTESELRQAYENWLYERGEK